MSAKTSQSLTAFNYMRSYWSWKYQMNVHITFGVETNVLEASFNIDQSKLCLWRKSVGYYSLCLVAICRLFKKNPNNELALLGPTNVYARFLERIVMKLFNRSSITQSPLTTMNMYNLSLCCFYLEALWYVSISIELKYVCLIYKRHMTLKY